MCLRFLCAGCYRVIKEGQQEGTEKPSAKDPGADLGISENVSQGIEWVAVLDVDRN